MNLFQGSVNEVLAMIIESSQFLAVFLPSEGTKMAVKSELCS